MLPLTTSERKCVIKGCGNISMFKQSHQFPSMPDRCLLWLQAIGPYLDDDLVGLPIDKFKRRIVCVDHFDPSCISPQSPRFLKRSAVPSIFPEDGVPVPAHLTPGRTPTAAAAGATRTITLPKPNPEDRKKMFLINKSTQPLRAPPLGPTLLIQPLENIMPTQHQIERRLLAAGAAAGAAAQSTEAELPMYHVSSHCGRRGRGQPALKITKVYPNRKPGRAPGPAAEPPPPPSPPAREAFREYLEAWDQQQEATPAAGDAFGAVDMHDDIQVVAVAAEDWAMADAESAKCLEADNNNIADRKLQEAISQFVHDNLPSVPTYQTPKYVAPSPPCLQSSPYVPRFAQYLLVGGGAASVAACRAIRTQRPNAKILIVTNEYAYPYRRSLLSKSAFWRRTELADLDQFNYVMPNGDKESLLLQPEGEYTDPEELWADERGAVAVVRGYTLRRVDALRRAAVVSAPGRPDVAVHYGECLIATGASPKPPPAVLETSSAEVRARCVTLRSARDARELWRRFNAARGVVVVGGGYLGSELAGALADRVSHRGSGTVITHIFREAGVMWHVLPDYLSRWSMRQLVGQGVRVCNNTEILNAYMRNGRVTLELSNAEVVEADVIAVCIGSVPNTQFAEASRLELHPQLGGLLVNADYCVQAHLYAAGDVACYYDAARGRRRGEHASHAAASGRACGLRMAGAEPPRAPLTELCSRLGPSLRYEAIGIVDSNLEMTGAFSNLLQLEGSDRNYDKGVVFYLQQGEIVGVLLWNLRGRMHIARQVLSEMRHQSEDISELADLFIISDSSLRKLEAEKTLARQIEEEDNTQLYQCEHCGETVISKHRILQHLSDVHTDLSCQICSENFPTSRLLNKHYEAHLSSGKINLEDEDEGVV